MLLFKRGIRKVIPGIVIPGINTKYIPQFISKDDNFPPKWQQTMASTDAVMTLSFPLFHSWREFCDDCPHDHNRLVPHNHCRLLSFVESVYWFLSLTLCLKVLSGQTRHPFAIVSKFLKKM